MNDIAQQPVLNFSTYPAIEGEDWRYAFASGQVRVLETLMLSRSLLMEIVNAESFDAGVDMLNNTEYALPQGERSSEQVEEMLTGRRHQLRNHFDKLMLDDRIIELFHARQDFANLRLALRRKLTDKPIGNDYSHEGSVSIDDFIHAVDEEDYAFLPFYMREAIEAGVMGYYKDRDIRGIDFGIDHYQNEYSLRTAEEINSGFLLELFRMNADLTNLKTMLRVKFTQLGSGFNSDMFLDGAYIHYDKLRHAVESAYDSIPVIFYTTPYHEILERGIAYLVENNSFVRFEQRCEQHILGYLNSTIQITAGHQPVVAYLIKKENEIRRVRLILTAKKNKLDNKLVQDRLEEV